MLPVYSGTLLAVYSGCSTLFLAHDLLWQANLDNCDIAVSVKNAIFVMQIVAIVGAVLVAMGSKTDYATGFLDLVVYLMQQGCVTPALSMISSWASSGSADPLLVRHFIFRTLLICAPPYSAYFTSILLRCLEQLCVCCLLLCVPVSFAVNCAWLFAHVCACVQHACPMLLGDALGKVSTCSRALCDVCMSTSRFWL